MATSYEGPGYVLHLTVDRACLIVRQTGRLPSLTEARRVQKWIGAECIRHRITRLVIDNRQTEAPETHVRDDMRKWVQSAEFEAIAMVLNSELLRVGVNMDALQAARRMRAFRHLNEALHWAERHRSSPVERGPLSPRNKTE